MHRPRSRRAASALPRQCAASRKGKRSAQRNARRVCRAWPKRRALPRDAPSGQGLVQARLQHPLWSDRKWWPGEGPQASPAGTKPNRRARKGIPVSAQRKCAKPHNEEQTIPARGLNPQLLLRRGRLTGMQNPACVSHSLIHLDTSHTSARRILVPHLMRLDRASVTGLFAESACARTAGVKP